MRYENPIIRGFNPDPSVCRVGKDYYLVTSSFEFFPGIPIYHSTDLVNWRQIGSCIDRIELLPFETARAGEGVWAPTIRYDRGMFYVTATFKGYGNFIVHSADPAAGWSAPVRVNMTGIDPSLLFDGGRAYYCTNQRGEDDREAISLAGIDPDTGELLTPPRVIWHGMSDDRPQYLEAPHVYHIGDWYYLLAAEGGTGFEHMITAARSREIWGPYASCEKPLLTNRFVSGTGVACSGHGDLVEDEMGNWWAVHLATRPDDGWYSHLGRETFLLPVAWQNDWPAMADGVSHIECDGPLKAAQKPLEPWDADLSRRQPQWLFLRGPVWARYAWTEKGLTLTPSTEKLSDALGRPTFLAARQMDIDCTAEAEILFEPIHDGSEAGLTVFIADYGHYVFCKKREGGKALICVRRQGGSFAPVEIPAEKGPFRMRIEASKRQYVLSCAWGAQGFRRVAAVPVLTRADAGKCFTGTLIGVYAQSDREGERKVEILSFRMKPGR